MTSFGTDDVVPARVISEDDDFILLEVGKHEGVKFTLDENVENNRFETILFCSFKDGQPTFRKPWERDG